MIASHKTYSNHPICSIISGPPTPCGVIVIRVSGKNCHSILNSCFPKSFQKIEPRVASLISFKDPKTQETLDKPLVVKFKGPHSFTGEDVVEISFHGSVYIVKKALSLFYSLGIERANPGEFSFRAFLNQKMDLCEAEGLADLIESQSQQQWQASRQLLDGSLKKYIESLKSEFISMMSLVEASIDFPDEGDIPEYKIAKIRDDLLKLQLNIQGLISNYKTSRVNREGLRVSLIGIPNSGKSTLLNALLGFDRSIISPEEGTTRDYIEEKCLIDGNLFCFVDTAGIRETKDRVEKTGIEHSVQIAKKSDIVLFLIPRDIGEESYQTLKKIVEELRGQKILYVETKSDLKPSKIIKEKVSCVLSSHSDESIQNLKTILVKENEFYTHDYTENKLFISERHRLCLSECDKILQQVIQNHIFSDYEILAFELKQIVEKLSEITGHIHHEVILDKIFSKFCVGK